MVEQFRRGREQVETFEIHAQMPPVGPAWPPQDWLHDRRALDVVRDAWRELRTFNEWLADNVGTTTKEIRRR